MLAYEHIKEGGNPLHYNQVWNKIDKLIRPLIDDETLLEYSIDMMH